MTKITTPEMEIALAEHFGIRQNLIVPNVSWGMNSHECDLFILTPAGYGWEVEIKVSKADLFKDKEKRHGHNSYKIKFLYFAIPEYLERYIDEIPERAGVIIVRPNKAYECGYWCDKTILPTKNGSYKYTDLERLNLARLGAMRIWGLKRKVEKLNNYELHQHKLHQQT